MIPRDEENALYMTKTHTWRIWHIINVVLKLNNDLEMLLVLSEFLELIRLLSLKLMTNLSKYYLNTRLTKSINIVSALVSQYHTLDDITKGVIN